MMVKSPAAVALLFVAVVVGRAAGGGLVRRVAKGLAGTRARGRGGRGAMTLARRDGLRLGRDPGVAGRIHTALSVSSDLGLGLGELLRLLAGTDPDPVKSAVQNLGLLAAAGALGRWPGTPPTGRPEAVHGLGLALVALVALSPMVQPWYLLWAHGGARRDRGRRPGRWDVPSCCRRRSSTRRSPRARPRRTASCWPHSPAWPGRCSCAGRRPGRGSARCPASAGPADRGGRGADARRGTMTGRHLSWGSGRPAAAAGGPGAGLVNQRTRTAPDGGS